MNHPPAVAIVRLTITRNRIKHFLTRHHLSQEECARRVGVSSRHFNRIVLGKSIPSLEIVLALCVVLGTTVEDLFTTTVVKRALP